MADKQEFVWTWPVYILVVLSDSGNFHFHSPDNRLGIFTDKHLADSFCEQSRIRYGVIPVPSPAVLLALIDQIHDQFDGAMLDMNLQTKAGRYFSFDAIVRALS